MPGETVVLNFGVEREPCPQMWEPVIGSEVDFAHSCPEVGDCPQKWVPDVVGSQVDFDFACDGGDEPPPPVFLSASDAWSGESASSDIEILPFVILGDIESQAGEQAESDLSATYALSFQSYTGEWLDAEWLISATFWSGETLQFELEGDLTQIALSGEFSQFDFQDTLLFNVGTGEHAEQDLDLEIRLQIRTWTGEASSANLAPSYGLELQAWTGESSEVVDTLEAQSFTGESSGFEFYDEFGQDAATGEFATFSIQETLLLTSHAGEFSTSDLDLTLKFVAYDGENATSDIAPSITIAMDAWVGEYSESELKERDYSEDVHWSWSGESATYDLTTSAILPGIAWVGEFTEFDLSTRTFDQDIHWSHSGESSGFSINVDTVFQTRSYAGEASRFEFQTASAPFLENMVARASESSNFTLSVAYAIGGTGYAGEIGQFDLGELPNYVSLVGETAEFILATDPVLELEFHTGEVQSVLLKTGPSEPVGIFWARDGEYTEAELFKLRTVVFYPRAAVTGEHARFKFEGQDEFDSNYGDIFLQTVGCCPPKSVWHSHEHIDLANTDPYEEPYDGDGGFGVLSFELHTAPRLYFTTHAGEYSDISGGYSWDLGSTAGEFSFFQMFTDEMTIRLCEGNFVPAGDQLLFEMSNPYNDDCEAFGTWGGETSTFDMLFNQNFQFRSYTGEYANGNLTTDPVLIFRSWAGEMLRFSWPMEFRSWDGEFSRYELPKDEYNSYTGETSSIDDLVVKYEVEFVDVGVLENDNVPADEQGDADWFSFRPMSTELDDYYHMIKVRCF